MKEENRMGEVKVVFGSREKKVLPQKRSDRSITKVLLRFRGLFLLQKSKTREGSNLKSHSLIICQIEEFPWRLPRSSGAHSIVVLPSLIASWLTRAGAMLLDLRLNASQQQNKIIALCDVLQGKPDAPTAFFTFV